MILNEGNTFTFRRGNTGTAIDTTMALEGIAKNTLGWKVLQEATLSDHQYIEFVVCTNSFQKEEKTTRIAKQSQESGWKQGKLDKDKLQRFLEDAQSQGRLSLELINPGNFATTQKMFGSSKKSYKK